ncbi:MalY/PatB family protein [Thermoflavimicrobium daqui]|jgi:cystathionine beta-lyase|uniref:cysteine-S-conjugate beta-lyase n=1 Tax=Thermoflavimicrobium daqui TaxID=2137476 RepID=A0A364K465_9BACL|nr:MalY/PatB family protein [Thermoflavimicrobium daqui]RAL24127.1 cystathionine beta-lyase [Thermoflavimicrobium daqui]
MQYNFDEKIERYHSASEKWDAVENLFGNPEILPMWVADMDFRSPLPVINAFKERAEHGVFGYTIRSDSYYDAIINWMSRRHHWHIKKEWICYSPGVMPAISFIIRSFSNLDDKILIQPPVYYPFAQAITKSGRKVINNPLRYENGKYSIDFDDLREKLDSGVKIFILCNPHNPVGRVWTKEELTKLGEMCLERNVLVIADEIHHDLIYKDFNHTPYASLSHEIAQHTIVCTSPSKSFNLAGLQTANMIIPNPELREQFKKILEDHFLDFTNTFGVIATEKAYQFGEAWLDQCMKYIEENCYFLTSYLNQHIPKIKVVKPEATYLVWLDFRELGIDAKSFEKLMLEKAKVAFHEGYIFGQEGEGFTRMNIACPRALLEEGLNRMKNALQDNHA